MKTLNTSGKLAKTFNPNKEKYKDIEDKGLKWDLIKIEIRSFSITYAKRKARQKKNIEKEFQNKLNTLIIQAKNSKSNPVISLEIQTLN